MKKFKYLRGADATSDGIVKAIQVLLDAHPEMANPFAALTWTPEGALIEMHFEPAIR